MCLGLNELWSEWGRPNMKVDRLEHGNQSSLVAEATPERSPIRPLFSHRLVPASTSRRLRYQGKSDGTDREPCVKRLQNPLVLCTGCA